MPFVLGNLDEHHAGHLTRGRSKLDSVTVFAHDLPSRRGLPPSRERRWITAVDNNFLETKSHGPRLGRRPLPRQETVIREDVSLRNADSRRLR